MSGAGRGHVELVVAVVGLVIAAVLLAISLFFLVTHRGAHRTFGLASAVAIVGTVGLLSFI
ncbi:MAG TPA: hypothetical protein VGH76_18770 [Actinomycetospora sp.]|jgi:hypothetical protein|uniref:hypothetical protein n=1 Tax=Actinomycetospora sp. TaxID=1872135 RepID=UPI002F414EAF